MNGAFTLFPLAGRTFDINVLKSELLRNVGVIQNPVDHNSIIVTNTNDEAIRIAQQISKQPNKPQWVVFLHLSPSYIYVGRQAYQEIIDHFRPMLIKILKSGVGSIKDEEGKLLYFSSVEEVAEELLAS